MRKADFLNLIEELMELSAGSLREDSILAELPGWDSMAIMGFINLMDEELHLNPAPKAIVSCRTVSDLLALGEGSLT